MPIAPLRLSSRRHPLVRLFHELATTRGAEPRVLLDGAHLLREALAAHLPVETVFVSPAFSLHASQDDLGLPAAAARAGAAVYDVTAAVMDAASPVRTPSGIAAVALWTPAPLDAVYAPRPALVVGLVDVQDPGNLGAAIRSTDALGGTGIACLDRSADPGAWKALRGAMGSTFRLPVACASTPDAIAAARRQGVRVVAAAVEATTALERADLRAPVLLLVGNEGAGLDATVLGASDDRVRVAMRPGSNSLNVAVTAALLLYEAARQRAGA